MRFKAGIVNIEKKKDVVLFLKEYNFTSSNSPTSLDFIYFLGT